MTSKLKRLTLAAILSGTGFAVTFAWYKATDRSSLHNGEQPLAQVGSVSDEVLRRPPTRLLWHSVNTGDPLFNGETIRTSQLGEVRIQFEDGRFIDIESDSLIVLSKSEGEISLDLMEGSLFVNAKTEGQTSGLVMNTAQGKVDLSGASASLSKTEGQSLNLQVVEGSAKVKSKDGQTKEVTSGKTGVLGMSGLQFDSNQIKLLSPAANKSVYIDPTKKPEVSFSWTGFPQDWKVSLLVGQQRRQLKEIKNLNPGESKTVSLLSLGRHYWKVVGRDPVTNEIKAESSVNRLDVMARSTPALLSPAPNSAIEMTSLPGSVSFRWQKSEEASQLVLEVASDALLRQKIVTKRVDGTEKFDLPNLNEGTYYWRLSSFYSDITEPWSGPVQQFKIVKKADEKPIQVQVNWEKFEPQQFYLEEPSMNLAWTAGPLTGKVSQWKVTWKEENNPESEPQMLETSDTKLSTKLARAGRYIASVEAFDEKGRPIGKSDQVQVAVEHRAALQAPLLLPQEGQLMAQSNGRSEISWTQIQGAKEYQLVVFSKEGKELLNKKYTSNKATLVNLMPGEYVLNLITIDQYGRPSPKATSRSLFVPDKSNLRAPALKKVKVN